MWLVENLNVFLLRFQVNSNTFVTYLT